MKQLACVIGISSANSQFFIGCSSYYAFVLIHADSRLMLIHADSRLTLSQLQEYRPRYGYKRSKQDDSAWPWVELKDNEGIICISQSGPCLPGLWGKLENNSLTHALKYVLRPLR